MDGNVIGIDRVRACRIQQLVGDLRRTCSLELGTKDCSLATHNRRSEGSAGQAGLFCSNPGHGELRLNNGVRSCPVGFLGGLPSPLVIKQGRAHLQSRSHQSQVLQDGPIFFEQLARGRASCRFL
jgi:hypothetical protein